MPLQIFSHLVQNRQRLGLNDSTSQIYVKINSLEMSVTVNLIRNPYPVPDLSREGVWLAKGPVLGKNVSPTDRRWYSRLSAHERLFAHHTLNSARKDYRFYRPKAPHDALDLALSSTYVHNDDTFVPKMYVHIQPETMGKETWRVLRNQIKTFTKPPPPLGHSIRYGGPRRFEGDKKDDKRWAEDPSDWRRKYSSERIHPSSIKLAIEGPHTDQTNPGFSRKIDGTFYCI
ncbi:uncharacterized protein C1orf194 homolog isoform X2 [Orussus abietinus]|uniref:uncharacterized protein C1orf194 homolog isoform X2 n=1 Tax=Orussus abietinus TaxID=222816 RepID=UPI00062516C3|nr:uncharacterized protein C1orf194 homolog isoform X2 [Orussus abietinus]